MAGVLRGKDVNDIIELRRQGLSLREISAVTGFDPKTIGKYLDDPRTPRYGPRATRPSLLDSYKPYIDERLTAGVWNVTVLLRELKARATPVAILSCGNMFSHCAKKHGQQRCAVSRRRRATKHR